MSNLDDIVSAFAQELEQRDAGRRIDLSGSAVEILPGRRVTKVAEAPFLTKRNYLPLTVDETFGGCGLFPFPGANFLNKAFNPVPRPDDYPTTVRFHGQLMTRAVSDYTYTGGIYTIVTGTDGWKVVDTTTGIILQTKPCLISGGVTDTFPDFLTVQALAGDPANPHDMAYYGYTDATYVVPRVSLCQWALPFAEDGTAIDVRVTYNGQRPCSDYTNAISEAPFWEANAMLNGFSATGERGYQYGLSTSYLGSDLYYGAGGPQTTYGNVQFHPPPDPHPESTPRLSVT